LASFWIASISGNTSVYGREPRYCRIALTKLVESLISFMGFLVEPAMRLHLLAVG